MPKLMYSKEESKKRIKDLLDDYSKLKEDGELDKLYGKGKEANTQKDFILRLFKALNWDTDNSKEVSAEETVTRGQVDYAFFIDDIPKFFVETKSMGESLNEQQKKQAINYSRNYGVTWAILTNFKEIMIFNCEWEEKHAWKNRIPFQTDIFQLFEEFDKLWLLSRDSFLAGELDKYAESIGKKIPKKKIDKILSLNKRLNEIGGKLINERVRVEEEIKKTDEEIDERVYNIYGIKKGSKERKIIEEYFNGN